MTTYEPDLAGLLSAISIEIKAMRFQVLATGELVLDGLVASSDQKRKIEDAAREAGFRTQNRLRVVPAAFAAEPAALIS